MTERPSRPAILFDRDGTLIEDEDYLKDPKLVRWIPGAIEVIRTAHKKNYFVFVLSNQSGIGRGWIQNHELEAVHREFCRQLGAAGEYLDGVAYCTHTPDTNCGCRKPKTGLVWKSFHGHPISWDQSFVVGDKACDLELGEALGAKSCLVPTGYGKNTEAELRKNPPSYKYLTLRAIEELITLL